MFSKVKTIIMFMSSGMLIFNSKMTSEWYLALLVFNASVLVSFFESNDFKCKNASSIFYKAFLLICIATTIGHLCISLCGINHSNFTSTGNLFKDFSEWIFSSARLWAIILIIRQIIYTFVTWAVGDRFKEDIYTLEIKL